MNPPRRDRWSNREFKVWRDGIRKRLVAYKGGKCQSCGIIFTGNNLSIFDFHHIDPTKKTGANRNVYGYETRRKEVENCLLLCANCHRLVHSKELNINHLIPAESAKAVKQWF